MFSDVTTIIIMFMAFAVVLTVWYLYAGRENRQAKYDALLRERINARWPHLMKWFTIGNHVVFYGDIPGMHTLAEILTECGEDVDKRVSTSNKMDHLLYIVRMCVAKRLSENPDMYVDRFLMVKYGADRHDLQLVSIKTVYPDLAIIDHGNGSLGFSSTNNVPIFTDKEREYFKM